MGQTSRVFAFGGKSGLLIMPMSTSAKPVDVGGQTGIARLLEAERRWQQHLETARAEAARVIAAALANNDAAMAAFEAELPQIIATRRAELDDEAQQAGAELGARLKEQIDRYAKPDAAFLAAMAEDIANRAPWFSAPSGGAS